MSFQDRGHFCFVHHYVSSACSVLIENPMSHWLCLWRPFTSSWQLLYVVHLCVCVWETSMAPGAWSSSGSLLTDITPGCGEGVPGALRSENCTFLTTRRRCSPHGNPEAVAGGQGPWGRKNGGRFLMEQEMATCSCILAWKIPCTEKPGGLQSWEWSGKESDTAEHTQYRFSTGVIPRPGNSFRCHNRGGECYRQARHREQACC